MIKKAAVINDLSGLGKCSLTAAIPVLSCLGVQACPLPTAVLTNQTGYSSYFMDDYTDKIPLFTSEWKKRGITFDAILTGFLANVRQADLIEDFISEFKTPETILIVDPVMGDGGQVYSVFTEELCESVKRLALSADVITPNLTEAQIILGIDPSKFVSVENVCDIAGELMELGPSRVVVTGVKDGGYIHNIVGDSDGISVVTSSLTQRDYSGTGDLFASVVTAGLVKGHNLFDTVSVAAKFIELATADAYVSATDRNDGIEFEAYLPVLWENLS